MPTFAAKFIPEWKNHYYEEFPELCVGSPREFIERMKSIEAGTYDYPFEAYADLIDLSGKNNWDVFRTNLGLPPNGPAPDVAPAETTAGTAPAASLAAATDC